MTDDAKCINALRQDLAELRAELDRARDNAAALVRHVGSPGRCKGCRAEISWIQHANGKRVPYDADGMNHFATCREAHLFREQKGGDRVTP